MNRVWAHVGLLSVLYLQMAACSSAHAASGCRQLPGTINANVRWPQVWQAIDQQAGCTQNCHTGGSAASANLDLSSQTLSIFSLVSQQSSQSNTFRVLSGDAKRSLFFQKINCTTPDVGNAMPPGGQFPIALQALIFDWIEQGAYGENPEDPIERDFVFRDSLESERRN